MYSIHASVILNESIHCHPDGNTVPFGTKSFGHTPLSINTEYAFMCCKSCGSKKAIIVSTSLLSNFKHFIQVTLESSSVTLFLFEPVRVLQIGSHTVPVPCHLFSLCIDSVIISFYSVLLQYIYSTSDNLNTIPLQ